MDQSSNRYKIKKETVDNLKPFYWGIRYIVFTQLLFRLAHFINDSTGQFVYSVIGYTVAIVFATIYPISPADSRTWAKVWNKIFKK